MFEIEQHTADIRIRLRSGSPEELFADGVRALMDVMKPVGASPPAQSFTIELDAPDRTALLVDLLNEILLRCHTRREKFDPESIVLHGSSVTARLRAQPVDAFEEDVKAVTYHEADVMRWPDGGWATVLVLDV